MGILIKNIFKNLDYEIRHFLCFHLLVVGQGSELTVVCWPLACRNNTLDNSNLEKLAILACRNS